MPENASCLLTVRAPIAVIISGDTRATKPHKAMFQVCQRCSSLPSMRKFVCTQLIPFVPRQRMLETLRHIEGYEQLQFEEVLFLDDEEANVLGANSLGMLTVQYSDDAN
jgi:FMN phosphatase YigB (HAD superfamily)